MIALYILLNSPLPTKEEYWGVEYSFIDLDFLAPTGAQEVIMCVCLSVC